MAGAISAAVVDFGSHFSDRLIGLVGELADVQAVPPEGPLPQADVVVFTGRSMRPSSHNMQAFALFRQLRAPAVGVCYGAEAYNLFAGGTLVRSASPISGSVAVEFRGAGFVKDGVYHLYEARHYRVGRLGRGLVPVAFSVHGVEAYVGNGFVGLLFHPEASGEQGRMVLASALSFLLRRSTGGQGLGKDF